MDAAVQAQLRQQSEARAYGEVGRLLMAAEYFEAAEPYLLHAQAQAPGEARWPYYLGHVHTANAEPAKAVAAFQRVLQLQPGDLATLVWLGNLHLDQGALELAEPLFMRAVSAQPRLVAGLFGLGRTALARRDFARAADYLEQALAADARATVVHYPLALAYRGLGDTAKAETHLRQRGGVEVGPPDPLMVELRGLLQGPVAEEARGVRALDAGDFPAAARHFRTAVEQAPDQRRRCGTSWERRCRSPATRRAPCSSSRKRSANRLALPRPTTAWACCTPRAAGCRRPPSTWLPRSSRNRTTSRRACGSPRRCGRAARSNDRWRNIARCWESIRASPTRALATPQRWQRWDGCARRTTRSAEAARLHPDEPRFAEALARVDGALSSAPPRP